MTLQVPKVLHISLVLYVLKHFLEMVSGLGLTVLDKGCQGIMLLCISGGGGLSPGAVLNHEKDVPLTWHRKK